MRILLLGGTADSREAAALLAAAGHEVVTSLAGRTAQARAGGGRVGGFGGVAGLVDFLTTSEVDAVVDATHPFAAQMSQNAAAACVQADVHVLRLSRPGWGDHPYAAEWIWVADHAAAAQAAAALGGRVLLTVGRQPLPAYHGLPDVAARVAEWQGAAIPAGWRIIEARGPYTLDAERALLRDEAIQLLVSKDSGGDQTAAKLDAAHELGVRVIMVTRPAPPAGVPEVATPAELLAWLEGRESPQCDTNEP